MFLSEDTNNGPKLVVIMFIMPTQMSQCVSSCLIGGCNYAPFTGEIYWFCHITCICSFKITNFPAQVELCKNTPSVQTLYRLRSKDSSGECSVNVDGQACFYPDEVKSTVRWPWIKKWQAACFMTIEVAQVCWLFAVPWTVPYRSSIHGIFNVRVLEWFAISFSRGSSRPRDQTQVSHVAGRCFTLWATRIHWKLNHLTKAVLEWKSRMSLLCFTSRWDAATTQILKGKWLLCDVRL